MCRSVAMWKGKRIGIIIRSDIAKRLLIEQRPNFCPSPAPLGRHVVKCHVSESVLEPIERFFSLWTQLGKPCSALNHMKGARLRQLIQACFMCPDYLAEGTKYFFVTEAILHG